MGARVVTEMSLDRLQERVSNQDIRLQRLEQGSERQGSRIGDLANAQTRTDERFKIMVESMDEIKASVRWQSRALWTLAISLIGTAVTITSIFGG